MAAWADTGRLARRRSSLLRSLRVEPDTLAFGAMPPLCYNGE